jgi:hypothetical protein
LPKKAPSFLREGVGDESNTTKKNIESLELSYTRPKKAPSFLREGVGDESNLVTNDEMG